MFRPSASGRLVQRHAGRRAGRLPSGRRGAATQRIHGWWWPDDDPKAPVVYYLHGARWNLTGHLNRIAQLRRFGFSVFAIDYRGFGKSDGDLPSEASVYEDARIGWQWPSGASPMRRADSSTATRSAVRLPSISPRTSAEGAGARGLIIESSFTSLADMASEISNGWLPVGLLLAEIRLDRQDPADPDAGAGGAWRWRPLRAVALQRSALRGGAGAQEAARSSRTGATTTACWWATPITGKRCARSSGRLASRRRLRTAPSPAAPTVGQCARQPRSGRRRFQHRIPGTQLAAGGQI